MHDPYGCFLGDMQQTMYFIFKKNINMIKIYVKEKETTSQCMHKRVRKYLHQAKKKSVDQSHEISQRVVVG